MINVQIVQPVVPSYRVSFFDLLANNKNLSVSLFASSKNPDGFKSESIARNYLNLNSEIIGFFGNRVFWQKGVDIQKYMGPGDVLVVCGNPRFLSNYLLFWKAKKRGIRIVWWGHGWSASSNIITACIRRYIMRISDVLLLYTDREVEEFKQKGFDGKKLFATNNTIDSKPIDAEIIKWTKDKLEKFKEKHNLVNKNIVIFCGRLVDKAKLNLIMTALAGPLIDENIVLVVIGAGDNGSELKRFAIQVDIDKKIIWLGEMYDDEQMAPWFLSAACFVYPGSIGLSLLHAFCYSLPVITHNNLKRQMPEIAALKSEVNGLLFEEDNVSDLAEKIMMLMRDKPKRELMSVQARKTIKKDYSMSNMVDRFTSAIIAATNAE